MVTVQFDTAQGYQVDVLKTCSLTAHLTGLDYDLLLINCSYQAGCLNVE